MFALHWASLLAYSAAVCWASMKRPGFKPAAVASLLVILGNAAHWVLIGILNKSSVPFQGTTALLFRIDLVVFCALPSATFWVLSRIFRTGFGWAVPAALAAWGILLGCLYPEVRGDLMVALQGLPRFFTLALSALALTHSRKLLRDPSSGGEMWLPPIMVAGMAGDVFGQWLQPDLAVRFWWVSHFTGSLTNALLFSQVMRTRLRRP